MVAETQQTFELPYLIQHGTADRLCMIEGTKSFRAATVSTDATALYYEGLYHEIYNECCLEADVDDAGVNRPVRDAIEWLSVRADAHNHVAKC